MSINDFFVFLAVAMEPLVAIEAVFYFLMLFQYEPELSHLACLAELVFQ